MHHLGIGTAHARKRVLAFADEHHITVADLTTGEILSTHQIPPNKTYRRNQTRSPTAGRAPRTETYVPRHHTGGEGGIRTPERGQPPLRDFQSRPFNRSGTSP